MNSPVPSGGGLAYDGAGKPGNTGSDMSRSPNLSLAALTRVLLPMLLAVVVAVALSPGVARAQGLSALARLEPGARRITDQGRGAEVVLSLSQGVPWRVFTLTDPLRVVMDFQEVDWGDLVASDLLDAGRVTALRFGT